MCVRPTVMTEAVDFNKLQLWQYPQPVYSEVYLQWTFAAATAMVPFCNFLKRCFGLWQCLVAYYT